MAIHAETNNQECLIAIMGGMPFVLCGDVVRSSFRIKAALAIFAVACDEPAPSAADAGLTAAVSAPAPSATSTVVRTEPADELTPLYPLDDRPPEPVAQRYCETVHDLVAERKVACCAGQRGASLAGECARIVSAALRSGALALDPGAVDACRAASEKELEGCGWIGPIAPLLPAACEGILAGKRAEGAACRSSLECSPGLRCFGLGATKPGKCGKPLASGACGTGFDQLAAIARQKYFEDEHPVCQEVCRERRCNVAIAVGAECKKSADCGRDHSCRAGKCTAEPLPADGEPCAASECARGLRCLSGRCIRPRDQGESCSADGECRGGCDKGRCAMRCG